ncbi:MAG: mechanosensitive ion channel family protein [Wenzhouxiangellaceae bacterium]|nr:mechanosensitive ion channel family protein [Wenzhouxiangellaceae bacterium]
MKEELLKWLESAGLGDSEYLYFLVVIGLIVVVSLVLHLALHRVVLRFLGRGRRPGRTVWQRAFSGHKLFSRVALALQGVVVFAMAGAFLEAGSLSMQLIEAATHLWIIVFTLLSLFSLLDSVEEISRSAGPALKLPLRGIFQSLKLVATTMALIFAVAFLIGKSPLILFSGLGAMTAVVLLIFKDPILGLVAGVQLSANNMLAVGDWLEMPRYGADGDVIDISLTTVKVRNWDKTITSIPSYALISDSFKNWRNIEEVGGRRIKRSINIDANSVRFATDDDLEHLRQAELLADYIENKLAEIDRYNRDKGVDPDSAINARRLTNLGILRAYLNAYLGSNANINTDLTYMVRHLDPGPSGIPLQVYAFANRTSWVPYENIQSDIFEHIFAVIPEFGLRLHQAPSGYDVRLAGEMLGAGDRKQAGKQGDRTT